MELAALSVEEFLQAAREFAKTSDRLNDGWKLYENEENLHNSYIKKECFMTLEGKMQKLVKTEYIVYYNLSYGVPAFSFNMWDSSGVLLTLEDIRQLSVIKINQKDFYSVITQQEHPVFCRPYFIMHPCQTETLLKEFKNQSKNIIVTFLGLITPLIRFNMPLEYGL